MIQRLRNEISALQNRIDNLKIKTHFSLLKNASKNDEIKLNDVDKSWILGNEFRN